jgi:hypothetical protein
MIYTATSFKGDWFIISDQKVDELTGINGFQVIAQEVELFPGVPMFTPPWINLKDFARWMDEQQNAFLDIFLDMIYKKNTHELLLEKYLEAIQKKEYKVILEMQDDNKISIIKWEQI